MKKTVFIDGRRIYLRPIDIRDEDRFRKWFNHPKLRKLLLLPFPITRTEQKQFIVKMTRSKEDVVLSIVVKRGDRQIGDIGLHRMNRTSRSASLGIAVADPSMTSKGYGTEATRLMLDYGFGTLNLHRIELLVHDFNLRAIGLYKKLGFFEEGRKREAFFWDGRYHDEILMSILKEEWLKNRGK